jgi:ribonuclease HI
LCIELVVSLCSTKPEEGWAKVNTDAAFVVEDFTVRSGVVIHDHSGSVIGAAARWFEGVQDVLSAEALAAKEGLELAVELGLQRVILELDCQGPMKLIRDPAAMRSSIGGLCFDISELGKSFIDFRVEWVRREANSVAHVCARRVSATERCFFWIDWVPDWLSDLAAGDCNSSMI